MATMEHVAELAAGLPGVTEGTSYGRRSWFVQKQLFVWERPFTKADLKRFGDETPPDGPIVGLATEDLAEKEAILEAVPSAFTITHLDGYPAVLVQLRRITKPALREMVLDAWLARAPTALAEEHLRKRSRRRG